jgi:hypothetical protein
MEKVFPPFLFFVFSLLPKIEMDLGLSWRALLRIKCGQDLPQLTWFKGFIVNQIPPRPQYISDPLMNRMDKSCLNLWKIWKIMLFLDSTSYLRALSWYFLNIGHWVWWQTSWRYLEHVCYCVLYSFFVNRTLVLKQTPNTTKKLNKNKNYDVENTMQLPLVPEMAWRCWLRTGSRPTGQEDHIRPGDKEEGITTDEAPWQSEDPPARRSPREPHWKDRYGQLEGGE